MLDALAGFSPDKPGQLADALDAYASGASRGTPEPSPESGRARLGVVGPLIEPLILAARWAEAVLTAASDADRFLRAARAQARLRRADLPEGRPLFTERASEYLTRLEMISDPADLAAAVEALARVPVSISLDPPEPRPAPESRGRRHAADQDEKPDVVVKAMFTIDGRPWASRQILRAGTVYDLGATLTVDSWPPGSTRLTLSYVTTLPRATYEITDFVLERPADGHTSDLALAGHVRFVAPQSLPSGPAVLRVRADFEIADGSALAAAVIGYHELSVRVSDPTITPRLSRYRLLDELLEKMLATVEAEVTGLTPDHLEDFAEAMGGVLNFHGLSLQSGKYKDVSQISEAEFQRQILEVLRASLGEEVIEAERAGGGPTDIRYRSITIELKVERSLKTVESIRRKYLSQTVQYGSAAGGQLGIVCVLDVTEKDRPPGDRRNYVSLETPEIHGYSDRPPPYPSRVAVVIIPANLRDPSSYS